MGKGNPALARHSAIPLLAPHAPQPAPDGQAVASLLDGLSGRKDFLLLESIIDQRIPLFKAGAAGFYPGGYAATIILHPASPTTTIARSVSVRASKANFKASSCADKPARNEAKVNVREAFAKLNRVSIEN